MQRYTIYFLLLILILTVNKTSSQEIKNSTNLTVPVRYSAELESVKDIAQRVSAMQNKTAAATSLGQIADIVWQKDEEFARNAFADSLRNLTVEEQDSAAQIAAKNVAYRQVISLIAKHDLNWTKDLVNNFAAEAGKKAKTNLDIAENLLESDPKLAAEFAGQSIELEITDKLIWFLKNLRRQKEAEANRLFSQILVRYPRQANANAKQYAMLGTYLFTSPQIGAQDYQNISLTRVGNIIFPNITSNLPNLSATAVREYLRGAITIINRPTNDSEQRQMKYALGHLLMPKAQEFAPNLVGELGGSIAALSSFVPSELTTEDAFANTRKKTAPPTAERLKEIEKTPDSYSRDQLYLDVVHSAWRQNDFAMAKIANAKIETKNVRDELEILISFGETKHLLESKPSNLTAVIQKTEKLPSSLEASMLWLGIARAAEKTKQPYLTANALDSARRAAGQFADENTPFLLLFISGEMSDSNPIQSLTTLNEAVRSFNRTENIKKPTLDRKVILDPLTLPFPLAIDGVNLDFQSSFQKAIKGNEENGIQIVEEITSEQLKGQAFVSLAKSILAKETKKAKPDGDEPIRVGEDGIRKSAVKKTMPAYPKDSLKKKVKGVAVAEVQFDGNGDVTDVKILESPDSDTGAAVGDALRQWKFSPSNYNGKPISIRGKITFYFVIGANGKGEVQNPKQYQ